MAFWDASAIIPLCCSQPATAQGRRLPPRELKRIVVWWGTPLEARSAFAWLVRERRHTAEERVIAIRVLRQLRAGRDEIQPNEKARSLAEELPDAHVLRAGDAAQLAAALVWCREHPKQRPLIAFDDRLRSTAAALGFPCGPSRISGLDREGTWDHAASAYSR